jgi:hypothetical protein
MYAFFRGNEDGYELGAGGVFADHLGGVRSTLLVRRIGSGNIARSKCRSGALFLGHPYEDGSSAVLVEALPGHFGEALVVLSEDNCNALFKLFHELYPIEL